MSAVAVFEPGHGATGLRLVPVVGDGMAPTLKPGDVVMVAPADRFTVDGIYALELVPGGVEIMRCQHIGGRRIRAFHDNPAYDGWSVTVEQFAALVIGRVAATGRVIAPELLRGTP